MKTRIVWTKFWTDDFVAELGGLSKLLFLYYFTNEHIGLTGIYELSDRVTLFETGISPDQLSACKKSLEEKQKVFFYKNWVYVVNAQKLGGYSGPKIDPAVFKEIDRIHKEAYTYFTDTVSIPYDTPKNHKSEIINKKEEFLIKKEEISSGMDINDIDLDSLEL